MPVFKQSSQGTHNFCLIHAIQLDEIVDQQHHSRTQSNINSKYVFLLISQEKAEVLSSRYFDKNSFVKAKIVINIYPPW